MEIVAHCSTQTNVEEDERTGLQSETNKIHELLVCPAGDATVKAELQPQIIRVKGPSPDYETAFSAMDHERAQALVVLEEPINAARRKQIAELAFVRRLPTVFAREQVDAGGLIAYGTRLGEAAKHMSVYADKILKGAKPPVFWNRAMPSAFFLCVGRPCNCQNEFAALASEHLRNQSLDRRVFAYVRCCCVGRDDSCGLGVGDREKRTTNNGRRWKLCGRVCGQRRTEARGGWLWTISFALNYSCGCPICFSNS